MPGSRTRRQRAAREVVSRSAGHKPKVDAYGTVRVLDNEYKARVMEFAPRRLAIFRDISPQTPVVLELTTDPVLKGRLMRTTFTAPETSDELELVFQKAGCGCETPRNLRIGRNSLMSAAGLT